MNSSEGAGAAGVRQANSAAFWLSVAGLAIQALAFVMIATVYGTVSGFGYGMFGMMGYYGVMMGPYFGLGGLWLGAALIALALGTLGVFWMNTNSQRRLRNGGMLVLLAAVFAFPEMWGFWIGSILMFVGAMLALATNPAVDPGRQP
ncbi:MAG: hypothetical protein JRM80_11755 [Nitrososphaerota archaeon]|nr:hypothetical protein [Nitrososphaerota archaeon]